MTVFYSPSDVQTFRVLEFFGKQTIKNVAWNWWPLPEKKLFHRAIGRNLAAITTHADWIWFCDCDYTFGEGCLDSLALRLPGPGTDLAYVEYVLRNSLDDSVRLIQESARHIGIVNIDPATFVAKRFNRAVGGLQIVRGDVARQVGYCKEQSTLLRPASNWMPTIEDVAFRRLRGTQGTPIQVANLFRLSSAAKELLMA
jgi:hypothetical protein